MNQNDSLPGFQYLPFEVEALTDTDSQCEIRNLGTLHTGGAPGRNQKITGSSSAIAAISKHR